MMRDSMADPGWPPGSGGRLAAGSGEVATAGRLRGSVVAVYLATAMLGLVGFVVSFERVSAAARPSFGVLAPAVPIGVDLGILVFSAAGLLLAYLRMPARWLRLVPAGLTGVTIALNVTGQRDLFGIVAHATLPGLWVLAVAIAEHVVRCRLAPRDQSVMDSVRVSRWLLAPLPTAALWRRMVLWEERSYDTALTRERGRLLAVAALRDTFGLLWRVRAPRRLRVLYRLGDLQPEQVAAPPRRARRAAETTPAKRPDTSIPPVTGSDPVAVEGKAIEEEGEPTTAPGGKLGRALTEASRYHDGKHRLPTVPELMEATGISQRTCERALVRLRESRPLRGVV